MSKRFIARNWLSWSAIALTAISGAIFAADRPTDFKAVTNAGVKVPVDVLSQRLKPLTKCGLEAEAQARLLLLKDQVTEISNAEVAAIQKKEEIKKTEQVESTLEDAQKAKEAEPEAAQEAARNAEQARKETKDAAMKSSRDSSVREAIEAAKEMAKEDGLTVNIAEKTKEAEIKTALIKRVTVLMAERTALLNIQD